MLKLAITIIGYWVFITDGGRLGRARGEIEARDLLCLFNRSPMLHVIRSCKARNGTDAYKLVGLANVQGMMNGEVDSWGLEGKDVVLV
jgi:hypothetical protein